MLRGAVRSARSGEPSRVVLVGEGGVGKTRLLGEVSTFARQSGIAVLSGRAPIVSPRRSASSAKRCGRGCAATPPRS